MIIATITKQALQLRTPKGFASELILCPVRHPRAVIRVGLRLSIISYAMPPTLDALAHDALILPPDQRVALAYRLLVSVEPAPETGAETAWDAEIAQRIARFDSGEAQPVPGGEVFARLHQIAPD